MEQLTRGLVLALLFCVLGVPEVSATSVTHNASANGYSLGFTDVPLVDIYSSGTVCNGADDNRCGETSWGFDFTRWGQTFDGGRQNTNGCLNLVNAAGGSPSGMCNDYTPQPLPYRDYTIYPFWTDLIRGTATLSDGTTKTSKMAYQNFGSYVVYGWYFMKEYGRASSNSFEVVIRNNNSYAFLYGELDIQNHDVLIGEQGKGADGQSKTFYYYDDNTGGHNTFDSFDNASSNIEGTTTNTGWTSSVTIDTASHDSACDSDPLSSSECSGYATAYAAQQLLIECTADQLYSTTCGGYEVAYELEQCDDDPLYSSLCTGYASALQAEQMEEAMDTFGYSEDERNMMFGDDGQDMGAGGYDPRTDMDIQYDHLNGEQQMLVDSGMSLQDAVLITMGQDDLLALGLDPSMQWNGTDQMGGHIEDEYTDIATLMLTGEMDEQWEEVEHDQNIEHFGDGYEDFTMEEWYDVDVREFGQEQVDEWYGEEVQFSEEGEMVWETYDYALDPEVADDLMYYSHLDNEDLEYLIAMPDDLRDCPTCGMEEFFEEMDILEELQDLEDYEREALEEFEDEIFEEFIEEIGEERIEDLIDDEAFEEIISEDELEDLMMPSMEEEFFEEETRQEAPAEQRQEQIREQQEEIQERAEPNRDTRSRREKGGGSHLASAASLSISAAVAKADFGGDSTTAGIVQNILQDSGSSSQSSNSSGAQQSFQSDGSTSSNSGQSLQANSSGDTTFQQQVEQSTGQSSIEVTDSGFQGPSVSAFETADQQTQSGSTDFISSFDDGQGLSGSDQNFGSGLNDAIASGTGISDFLSQQTPDYGKFDLAPPSAQEQKVGSAVESLAERLGSEAVATNLAEQLDAVQSGEDGQYGDQTVTVAYMGYTAGFGQYTGMAQMTDAPGYGVQSQLPDTKIDDNRYGFYMMAGNTQSKLQQMINSQYRKEN